MFLQKAWEEETTAFLRDLRGGPDFRQKFISVLSRMTEDEWSILKKKVLELAREAREVREDSAEKRSPRESGTGNNPPEGGGSYYEQRGKDFANAEKAR